MASFVGRGIRVGVVTVPEAASPGDCTIRLDDDGNPEFWGVVRLTLLEVQCLLAAIVTAAEEAEEDELPLAEEGPVDDGQGFRAMGWTLVPS